MKQQKLVVDRFWAEHGLFRSSRKRQSQKTGSYAVTTSLADFQWLLRCITSPPHETVKGNALPRRNWKCRQKRGNTSYTIFILLKTLTFLLTYNYMVKNLEVSLSKLVYSNGIHIVCVNKAKLDSEQHSVTA